MAKKKKPAAKKSDGLDFDDRNNPVEDILKKAGLGDMASKIAEAVGGKSGKKSSFAKGAMIAAGAFAAGFAISKMVKGGGDLSHLNQADKKVKVLSFDTLLDGGTQEWLIEADGMRVRFDVDSSGLPLDFKANDQIYVYSSLTSPKKLLQLGGSGECQIAVILRRWLDQFWSVTQQKEMSDVEKIGLDETDDVIGSYPQTAKAAAALAMRLEARQKS